MVCLWWSSKAPPGGRIERLAGFEQDCVPASGVLPAPDRDVDVEWIEFNATANAAGFSGRYKRRARVQKRIEHDVATFGHIAERVGDQSDGLDRGAQSSRLSCSLPKDDMLG